MHTVGASPSPLRKSMAVVGGGAAGLVAAWRLQATHDVTLFERDIRLGGHALTVTLASGPDAGTALDLGFMIFNDRNYPRFQALLAELGGLASRPSEMSFGYQSADATVQYALNWRPGYVGGPTPRPPEPALVMEILRFFRLASQDLATGLVTGTYGEYLVGRDFSPAFIDAYAIPTGAALWSSAPAHVLAAPAAFVLGFYQHHGMLSLDAGPGWLTLVGGSRTYVERLKAALPGVRAGIAVTRVARHAEGVDLTTASGVQRFDGVVLATHADQALALLADPSPAETQLLGAWRYQASTAVLHADETFMPADRAAWASWNYVQAGPHADATGPTITYHLDRLQGLQTRQPYFLTLNPGRAPAHPFGTYDFTHPVYSVEAVASQAGLAALNGTNHTWFAGSYMGRGFHEDAVRAGEAAAEAMA